MSTSLAKTSKVIKDNPSAVRGHFDILDRAREIYLAQIKRAEADYFERLRRATSIIQGEEPPKPPVEQAAE